MFLRPNPFNIGVFIMTQNTKPKSYARIPRQSSKSAHVHSKLKKLTPEEHAKILRKEQNAFFVRNKVSCASTLTSEDKRLLASCKDKHYRSILKRLLLVANAEVTSFKSHAKVGTVTKVHEIDGKQVKVSRDCLVDTRRRNESANGF